jgi:hypothetical protein
MSRPFATPGLRTKNVLGRTRGSFNRPEGDLGKIRFEMGAVRVAFGRILVRFIVLVSVGNRHLVFKLSP